ncbi:MAG: tungstate transport system permease protein [Gammaproteobacteria bacterium]|jgi:tungstate transport system permease protein
MGEIFEGFATAALLIAGLDSSLIEIVGLSLRVSLTAVLIGAVIGLPLGAAIAVARFRGRNFLIICVNALMGLPPVVVGLLVYLNLSNAGPFGWLQLLYTPTAMIIAQMLLVTPIIVALSRQFVEDANADYDEELRSIGVRGAAKLITLIVEVRHSLLTVVLAAFGRAIAEVGAVIIVGGNINHITRVMTTAIALETSKGELGLALALGVILMMIAFTVNAMASLIKRIGPKSYGR